MTFLALLLLALALAAVVVLVVRLASLVRRDGYGHRPGPPSHHAWSAQPQG